MSKYKKRLISVISILDNLVVQSKNYKTYLPIGEPKIVVENLARWGSDEILIQCFNRSKKQIGPDLKILKNISNYKNATPIIYAGGIRDKNDALDVIKNGAERIMVGYSFFKNYSLNNLKEISDSIGRQSLILSLPIIIKNKKLFVYDFVNNINKEFNEINFNSLKDVVSEIMITDVLNEGYYDKFNLDIIDLLKIKDIQLIFFGGINSNNKIQKILKNKKSSAVGISNFLNFKEHAYQKIIDKNKSCFRNSFYEKK